MDNLKCPYCDGEAKFHESSEIIYGRDFGSVYICQNFPSCDSYVGCHKYSKKPLGRLADKFLRYWKKEAHRYFDPIWKENKINKIYPLYIADTSNRKKSYIWLSKELGLKLEHTHIGMFDIETCKRVIEICKPYYNE